MAPPAVVLPLLLLAAPGSPPGGPGVAAPVAERGERERLRTRLLDLRHEAAELLGRAAAGEAGWDRLLEDAAARLEALAEADAPASGASLLTPELRGEARAAAAALRTRARASGAGPYSAGPQLELLDRVAARLKGEVALGLSFQGSYSQTKVAEPVYGGHASAMGPPPVQPPGPQETGGAASSPVVFEEGPRLPVTTFCGGPTKDHILESGGSGVALFDYDGDGRLDVYVLNAYELSRSGDRTAHRSALFRNLGGWKFEDVSKGSGLDAAAWGSGVCAGDFDADGKLDLYVTNWGPNALYRNNGDGTFTDVAPRAGVLAPGWSTGCTFFDADGDGDLDLYVVRYVSATWADVDKAERTLVWRSGPKVMIGPVGLPGEADLYFENRGDGTFLDRTEESGLADPARAYGFGVVATDHDADGRPDLYVANDTNPNFLYRNLGGGRFESVGLLAGVALNAEGRAQAGMGVDSGDYDGDGRLDLVVTNFAQDSNTLYRNLGGGQFEDVTAASGIAGPTFVRLGWGVAFFDADLDGDLDLFFANGHIFPQVDEHPQLQETFRQKNQLFLAEGGRFRDVSDVAGGGLRVQKSSRGLAAGDLDGDGDVDLVVTNVDDAPTLLENRQQTGHHWVAFRLEAPSGNRFGIGARIAVTAAGRRQLREVRSGGSFLSQGDLRVHFGLGDHGEPVDVEVRLPGAGLWEWRGLAVDRLHTLRLTDDRKAR